VGLHLNIGRRFGDLVVLGEYDYLSVGETGSTGTMSRFGAVARYSLLRTKRDFDRPHKNSPVSGDYWLEAGAGLERLTWDSGGTLTRPDLVLGFGLQLDAVLGRKSDKPRYFGPYVSFRTIVARAPDSVTSAPATCASVCDTMTAPSQNDVSMFFHFGVNWGR
jgi:hypothetical protein